MEQTKIKKNKLTAEEMFNIYQECIAPEAPVKEILERHGLKPWDLVAIRKKARSALLEAFSRPGKRGRKKKVIPVEQYNQVNKELEDTKDSLTAICHELALMKKKVNLV